MARRSLIPPSVTGRRRTVLVVALALLALVLFAVLYPQLQDFGAELYRLFTGG